MAESEPKPECEHKHVRIGERWYGQGKYVFFQCNDCDQDVKPIWVLVKKNVPKPEDPPSS
jgi:hypothetical protein